VVCLAQVDRNHRVPGDLPACGLARVPWCAGSAGDDAAKSQLGFIRRRLPTADVYFVANTSNQPIEATAKLGVPAEEALAILDAEGKVRFPCEVELVDGAGTRVATASVQWDVRLNEPVSAEA